MSFSAAWLQLRAHADSRARDTHLEALLRAALTQQDPAGSGLIIDLGSGSGANCLHLAPRLDQPRYWCLVDNDPSLLQTALARCATAATVRSVKTQLCDLSQQLAHLPLDRAALLTASALLDLVSMHWLQQLAQVCGQAQLTVLIAGKFSRLPPPQVTHDELHRFLPDPLLIAAVNQHQRNDKGFGAALGPLASAEAERLFRAIGHTVHSARSDWQLDASQPADAALLQPLIKGWCEAAAEQQPAHQSRFADWQARRLQAVASGDLRVRVGHTDLLAVSAGTGSRRSQS